MVSSVGRTHSFGKILDQARLSITFSHFDHTLARLASPHIYHPFYCWKNSLQCLCKWLDLCAFWCAYFASTELVATSPVWDGISRYFRNTFSDPGSLLIPTLRLIVGQQIHPASGNYSSRRSWTNWGWPIYTDHVQAAIFFATATHASLSTLHVIFSVMATVQLCDGSPSLLIYQGNSRHRKRRHCYFRFRWWRMRPATGLFSSDPTLVW